MHFHGHARADEHQTDRASAVMVTPIPMAFEGGGGLGAFGVF
jgi:hypothetical protein